MKSFNIRAVQSRMLLQKFLKLLKTQRLAFVKVELLEDELGVLLDHHIDFISEMGSARPSVGRKVSWFYGLAWGGYLEFVWWLGAEGLLLDVDYGLGLLLILVFNNLFLLVLVFFCAGAEQLDLVPNGETIVERLIIEQLLKVLFGIAVKLSEFCSTILTSSS